jgi:hypothetical protein
MMCEELGRRINMGLQCPLLRFVRVHCSASSTITSLHPLTQSAIAFPSSSSYLKKEKENKVKMKGKLGIEFS